MYYKLVQIQLQIQINIKHDTIFKALNIENTQNTNTYTTITHNSTDVYKRQGLVSIALLLWRNLFVMVVL